MKLQIMSDIHNEFGPMNISNAGARVLILAGDVGIAHKPGTYAGFIEEACRNFEHVIMVMGNHEHYNGDIEYSAGLIRKNIKAKNFHLLDNSSFILDDITFIGATLWADIDPMYEATIYQQMNDFRIIAKGKEPFSTKNYVEEFNRSEKFITSALNDSTGKVVVVTHHSPTMKAADEYRGSILNSAYGSDLTALMFKNTIPLWVHGHTHLNMNYMIGDTQVLCNPRGYVGYELNWSFNPDLIVEV